MIKQEEIEKKEARKCEKCGKPIPDNFVNPLCIECYQNLEKEKEAQPPAQPVIEVVEKHKNGITEETYLEHPEAEDKDQVEANLSLFRRRGLMLWHPTREMYEFIKNYCMENIMKHPQYPKFIWKPKIVDVGCGCGVGSNVLSQEADFVWGIDKNEHSIKFAKECFTRVKNNYYYSGQITFDVIDVLMDTREFSQFDVVVAIEVIEHINDYKSFLKMLTRFDRRGKDGRSVGQNPTEYFISTPNRNNKRVGDHGPKNKFHVREWTSNEFYNVLNDFFTDIVFYNTKGEPVPYDEYITTEHTPLLAKCSILK